MPPQSPPATLPTAPPFDQGLLRRLSAQTLPITILALATALATGLPAGTIAFRYGLEDLDRRLADRLSFSAHMLSSEIERLRHLPRVLSQDLRIQAALSASDDPIATEAANHHLKRLREMAQTDEAYLVDARGLTIASSNWDEPGSFLGANYAFRPYFIEGMQRGEASYYAIGVTTGKPGAFLSSRVSEPGVPTGLSVVKMDLATIESAWSRAGEMTWVSDADGIVFLSSHPSLRFRPLSPLSDDRLKRLTTEQRYSGIDLAQRSPLPISDGWLHSDTLGTMRLHSVPVPELDWQMTVALPLAEVTRSAALMAGFSGATGAVAVLAIFALGQRRQILSLRQKNTERLETAVKLRTKELAQEIEERRRAEAELLRTQEGLVHAAKLAVLGRMSSAIVHEIGQSLSALDNNLAAAELHAAQSAASSPRLPAALTRARQMLRRLQGVAVRLRSFGARQSLVPLAPTDPEAALLVAAEIVAPRMRELGVTLHLPPSPLPLILADGPRLEQVLSNVLLNAADACAAVTGAREVSVSLNRKDQHIIISIRDTGSGLSADLIEHLCQPFVTCGKGADGFGLGLYIVQNLLEQMKGRIEFMPCTPRPASQPDENGTEIRLIFCAASEQISRDHAFPSPLQDQSQS